MQKKAHGNLWLFKQILTASALIFLSFSSWAQPDFNANFYQDTIGPGSTTTLIYTIENTDLVNPVSDLAFTNNLPANLIIATPAQAVSECVNGLLVAPDGGNTIVFTEGRVSAATNCTIQVNVTSAVPGVYPNTTGDLTSDAGNSGTASDSLTVDADRPGFSKSFSPNTVNYGDRSTLTFTIDSSLNTNDTSNLAFVDHLPVGMRVADPSALTSDCPQLNGDEFIANPGSSQVSYSFYGFIAPGFPYLQAGSTCTLSVDIIAEARGELNNTTENLTSNFENSGKAGDVLVVNSMGDIQLTQSFLDDPVTPGQQVTLQFNLSSLNRNFDITNISFSDDLDATLSGLVATGLPLNDVCGVGSQLSGTSVLSLSNASLTPEESCSFSVTLQVPSGASAGVYPNATSQPTGQITGQPTNGNVSTDSLFVNFAPQLTQSFIPASIEAGDITSMEFTLTNPSTTDSATDINFKDNISAFINAAQISGLPADGFCGAGSTAFQTIDISDIYLNISGANLAAGASCTFNVDLSTAQNTPPGTYTNTTEPVKATIGGQQYTGKTASADLTIEDMPQLNMSFTDDPTTPGDQVTVQYRISSAEEGNLTATALSFTHDLDATLTGLEAIGLPLNDVCGVGSQISGTNLLTLTGGTISGGTPCEFSINLQVPAAAVTGDYPSTTSDLTGTVSGSNITSPAASDTLRINALEFTKEFVDDPSLPGDTVTLEYTIDNPSPTDATAMFFTHDLNNVLPGLTAVAPLPVNPCGVGSSLTGTSFLILTGGNLLAGDACTFSVTLSIPAAAASNQYSSVTSDLSATIDGNPAVIDAANDLLTINNNLIVFSKNYLNNPVTPGNITTLEFTLSNTDVNNPITDLSFTDDLDGSLTGLVASGLPLNNVCGTGSQISGTSLLALTGGNLSAGASCTFSVDVTVPAASTPGVYTNTTSQANGMLNGLSIVGDPAIDDLLVGFVNHSKSFAGPVNTGDITTLTFNINNADTTSQSNLSFTDDLDAALNGLVAVGLPLNDVCGLGSQINGTSILTFTGGELAANSNCSFDVDVQVPAGLGDGVYTNITSELFQSGVPIAAPARADLQVNGVPFIDLSVTAIDFGSIEVGNTAAVQTTTISNTGTSDLTINGIDSVNTPFSLDASGSCPALPIVLNPGANCTLAFGFAPVTTGVVNQTIDILSDTVSVGQTSIQLSGNGLQALLAMNPNPIDFGVVELNTSSTVSMVTLTNNGTANLDVSNVSAASGDFSETGSTCGAVPFSLSPSSSCTISYQFSPSSVGIQSQDVTITSDSSTSPDTLTLQGEGVQASLTLSANQVNFPNTTINTTSGEQLITLSNTGMIELRVSALSVASTPFNLSGGSCSATPIVLAVNASCTLGFQFSPTTTGNFNQTLSLTSNASTSPDTFDLLGTGIEPGLQLSSALLDFQNIDINTTSAAMSITISNTDLADLIIAAIDLPTAPFSRSGGSCGSLPLTLASNQSCTIEYQFTPVSSRNFTQNIVIQSNAATSPDTFELRGTGVEPALILSSNVIDFGSVINGTISSTSSLSISNTGLGVLTVTALDQAMPPFMQTGGSCGNIPFTLSSGQNCSLDYQFMPTSSGITTQSISITSNSPSGPVAFDLVGNGLEVTLNTSNDSLNFAFTNVGDIQSQNVTLTSAGDGDVTINTISLPAAPFTVDYSDCGTLPITLSSGASCEVIINYSTESNASNGSILIYSDDPDSPLEILLSGSGLSEPMVVPGLGLIGILIMLIVMLLMVNHFLITGRQSKS